MAEEVPYYPCYYTRGGQKVNLPILSKLVRIMKLIVSQKNYY